MTDTLPNPLVPAECDLTDFKFMPLEVEQLRKSKAWLIARRRPELAFYMLNLWMRAWHERPAASIENDDDVLCDAAGCHPRDWAELRDDVLRGWVKCSDGRLYHPVIAEKALETWRRKVLHRYDKECLRRRKAFVRAGGAGTPPVYLFEDYLGEHFPGALPFADQLCPPDKLVCPPDKPSLSSGQPSPVHETSQGCPLKIALKGQGQGQGQGYNFSFLGEALASAIAAAQEHGPEFIRLPTNRFDSHGEEVLIFQTSVDELQKLYPAVDVPQQLRGMRGWLDANEKRRKTRKGMKNFVNSWLQRRQDKGGDPGMLVPSRGPAIGAIGPPVPANGDGRDIFNNLPNATRTAFEGVVKRVMSDG